MFASVVVAGAVLVSPLAAQAVPHPQAPAPKTSAQVTAKLLELAKSSEKLSEQLNQAQIDVAAAQRLAAQATRAAAAAEVSSRTARHLLANSLASQYKSASFSRTAALLASNSSEGYLQTIQSMNLLSQHQSDVVLRATKTIQASDAAAARAKAAVATAVAKRALITQRRDDLNRQVSKYKALLATLTAAERARYFTPAPAPARVITPAAPVAQAQTMSAPRLQAASSGASAAIAAARAQLGKPYAWGASGPDAFDCSGLTAWAWRAAGVSLPHSAAAQQGMGSPVNRSDLQPGDLVFFGSPAYHVAMYLGDGMIIHAPTTGDVVKIVSLSYMSDYSGATRVG